MRIATVLLMRQAKPPTRIKTMNCTCTNNPELPKPQPHAIGCPMSNENRLKNANVLEISGLRWFQRSYGNTYHTVQIRIDGETVFTSECTYGYGSGYMQTAMEWLESNGYLDNCPEDKRRSWAFRDQWLKSHNCQLIDSVNDVLRQRDLH